jgi:hypothetical protein
LSCESVSACESPRRLLLMFNPLIVLFEPFIALPTYRLAASPTYIEPVPRCWSSCEYTWPVVPPLC